MRNDSVQKTLIVAFSLCLVCSILVSGAAVLLRPTQEKNRTLDKRRNILATAGLMEAGKSIDELFQKIEAKAVDLASGEFTEAIDPESFDAKQAVKDPEQSIPIPKNLDAGGIKRRPKYEVIYLVKEGGKISKVILPVNGKGLWSTLYGFLALGADLKTIRGLSFYQHGETPGLGGEVDNPNWKAQWDGKLAFGEGGEVKIEVIRGIVDTAQESAKYQVDGLSGATITSRGVRGMMHYWLGPHAYGPLLTRLKSEAGRYGE